MKIAVDPERTRERRATLEQYLSAEVLRGDAFVCRHQQACKASHDGEFYEGQLHHLGPGYDVSVDGTPLRVAVIGQEYGQSFRHVSLEARHRMILETGLSRRFKAEPGYRARNPHMKGTTSALRLIFGRETGADHTAEYLTVEDGQRMHLYECFALVNYLLCSAVKAPSRRGCSTETMKRNCGEHFRHTLEILEPSVVIVQGRGFWTWVRQAFDGLMTRDDVVYGGRIGGQGVQIAAFTHPSATGISNWGANDRTPYLQHVVRPALREIRRRMGLA